MGGICSANRWLLMASKLAFSRQRALMLLLLGYRALINSHRVHLRTWQRAPIMASSCRTPTTRRRPFTSQEPASPLFWRPWQCEYTLVIFLTLSQGLRVFWPFICSNVFSSTNQPINQPIYQYLIHFKWRFQTGLPRLDSLFAGQAT